VDSAAVAAANNIKAPQADPALRKQRIVNAAIEMLYFNDVPALESVSVKLCDDADIPEKFASQCPKVGEPPRKLAWVEAKAYAPVYFLRLFGIGAIPMSTSATGEAATLDLVLVFDTSESMGKYTTGYAASQGDFNPATCNANNDCQPLRQAKDAAKSLVGNLFQGYDRVGIVSFDYNAEIVFSLSENIGDDDGQVDGDAYSAIDNLVRLHNDPPTVKIPWMTLYPNAFPNGAKWNPIYPDDRDGDGHDRDASAPCTMTMDPGTGLPTMWDMGIITDTTTWVPCDDDNILDVFDWNGDGDHTNDNLPSKNPELLGTFEPTAILSTCTGCGVREATNMFANFGRQNGVWVMVFLSDGRANLSDLPATNNDIPSTFIYGFCGKNPLTSFWYPDFCSDLNGQGGYGVPGRYCLDTDSNECPPNSIYTSGSGPYSVDDYARDMVDAAALLLSENKKEPRGQDIVIYSIGLGDASKGEDFLRYMANVGDEGSRGSDACGGVPSKQNCGNYYYAPDASYLAQVFESIANRIFTKISR
jgi:hypothetical protein